jgi:hypothetical protein
MRKKEEQIPYSKLRIIIIITKKRNRRNIVTTRNSLNTTDG